MEADTDLHKEPAKSSDNMAETSIMNTKLKEVIRNHPTILMKKQVYCPSVMQKGSMLTALLQSNGNVRNGIYTRQAYITASKCKSPHQEGDT